MTRRLRGGPEGDGGLTAEQAVAAMNAWRQWGTAARFTPLVTSSPTPTSYFQHTTPVLVAGFYRLVPTIFVTGSAAGTQLRIDFQVDAVPFPPILTEASVTGGGFLLSGIPPQNWTAGDSTHTMEFLVAQPAGPGQVTAQIASFEWERVA